MARGAGTQEAPVLLANDRQQTRMPDIEVVLRDDLEGHQARAACTGHNPLAFVVPGVVFLVVQTEVSAWIQGP